MSVDTGSLRGVAPVPESVDALVAPELAGRPLWREPVLQILVACAALVAVVSLAALTLLGAPPVVVLVVLAALVAVTAIGLGGVLVALGRAAAGDARADLAHDMGEAIPFPCCVVDATGRAIYANGRFRAMLPDCDHAPLAALAGLGDARTTGAKVRALSDAAERGAGATEEAAVVTEDGGVRWLQFAAYPFNDAGRHVLWTLQDISAQREMEHIVHDEQARLADLLEHAPVGFYSVDGEGEFALINETLADWLGTSYEEIRLKGLRLHDFLADRPTSGAAAHVPFADPAADRGEVALKALDGRIIQAFVTQSVVGETPQELRTRSVVRDLTPEHAWEQALRRSEQRFQRFFENAPVGIVLVDGEGRITECNRAWRQLAPQGQARTAGRPLTDFVVAEEVGKVSTWLARTLGGGEDGAAMDVTMSGEGASPNRVFAVFASRLEDTQGSTFGLILHFLDTTEQKNLEQQFAQSQEMQAVGQLAGGIAHDFNNLLTAMIGFCDLLLLRHSPGDESFADIMQIKQNANRAANLVRQLLAFSRQQTLQPRVLNVTDVLADLSNLLRRLIGANIQLSMVHGRELGKVRVDQSQLEQVIINLAVNARDAMPEGGKLTIRTRNLTVRKPLRRGMEEVPAGDYVIIEVGDTGSGIAPENLERIFEPFYTTKEVGSGTGLGLSTVYGILKQTGGFVFVDSKLGHGAAFTIYLPEHVEAEPATAQDEAQEGDEGPDLTGVGTILLVEDEDAVRLFSARALRAKGYKVLEARTGENALEMLDGVGDSVDLLITDAVMPEMDGPTLIKEIRGQRPELKVICISGYAEDAFRKRLGESGDIAFLPKPFSLSQLAGKVKDVLGRPGA